MQYLLGLIAASSLALGSTHGASASDLMKQAMVRHAQLATGRSFSTDAIDNIAFADGLVTWDMAVPGAHYACTVRQADIEKGQATCKYWNFVADYSPYTGQYDDQDDTDEE